MDENLPEPSINPYFNPSKSGENYVRLCYLVSTIGGDLFRDILSRYIQPADLRLQLDKNRTKLERIMNAEQKEKIYPLSGTTTLTSKDLDISVLYILLRNICSIPKHKNGWGNPPLDGDTSLAACIERIRIQRNLIPGHSPIGEIEDTVFQDHWDKLKNSILEIEKQMTGGNMYERWIANMLTCDLNPTKKEERFKKIEDRLKKVESSQWTHAPDAKETTDIGILRTMVAAVILCIGIKKAYDSIDTGNELGFMKIGDYIMYLHSRSHITSVLLGFDL
ncbi:uncharacterized protein LOC125656716 [Ostrea edulis]|uniref:uncharacterized protein LOC125656716 n=1 Tax=Ostrea edulis TaxID=37623 RepID=UPI0024AF2737|nr:uncharacterized protein LOC125656716 [Ostrea edulis]XP_055999331.1 uncharacterized protein LOC125656716 [Ostrea edulis]